MQFGNDASDGQRFLLLVNAGPEPVSFRLAEQPPGRWVQIIDTRLAEGLVRGAPEVLEPGGTFALDARSLVLLTNTPQEMDRGNAAGSGRHRAGHRHPEVPAQPDRSLGRVRPHDPGP